MEDFTMVLEQGRDLDMTKICGCSDADKMSDCEATCGNYYDCCNIALANDILVEYEMEILA